jgi:hypothetical protein
MTVAGPGTGSFFVVLCFVDGFDFTRFCLYQNGKRQLCGSICLADKGKKSFKAITIP